MEYNNIIRIISVCCASIMLVSCASKSITKPRSQIVSEASNLGKELRSIKAEKRNFYRYQEQNKNRMLALIKARAEDTSRKSNYRIGSADGIEINVFDVPELNVTVRVRESGFISLPLVGAVRAAGLTESELLQELNERLSSYVKDPQASVYISHYGSQRVAVLGAVRTPGTYSLKKGSNSMLELISEAGGLSEKAGNFLYFIPAEVSGIGANSEVEAKAKLALASYDKKSSLSTGLEIDLDQVLGTSGGIPLEVPIRGGDMIILPEAGRIVVEGEVEKTGSYELSRGITLLNALASAGGITYGAKIDEVELIRDIGADEKGHLIVDLEKIALGVERDVKLRNGDIVRVPSDSGRRMGHDTFDAITRIINFGVGGTVSLP